MPAFRIVLVLLVAAVTGCAPVTAAAPSSTDRLAAALSGMMWPLPLEGPGGISSGYGARGSRHHDGLDLPAPAGTAILAARSGRVVASGWQRGYGNTVVLDHGEGVRTLYAHASILYVSSGDHVRRGDPIAAVGASGNATGNHLHFELSWAGRPVDPRRLLPLLAER
jgi:murein DD-endopeptidase MepM/ murein hydrolase activator NlpD